MKRWRFIVPLLLGCLSRTASGITEAEFRQQYPVAVARIKDVYAHMHAQAEFTSTIGSAHRANLECWKSGDFHKSVEDHLDGPKKGAATALSNGKGYHFNVARDRANSDYAITWFDRRPVSEGDLRVGLPLFYAPYCVRDLEISELLKDPRFKILSVDSVGDLVRVVWETPMRQEGMTSDAHIKCRCDFLSDKCWALASYEMVVRMPGAKESSLDYGQLVYSAEEKGVPLLSYLEQWVANPASPGVHKNVEVTNVTRLNLGPTPESEFALAAFGLADPFPSRDSQSRVFWLVFIALACAASGGYLMYRSRRGHQAGASLGG